MPECVHVISVLPVHAILEERVEKPGHFCVRVLLCVLVGLAGLLPAPLAIKLFQALNEKASGLVANH